MLKKEIANGFRQTELGFLPTEWRLAKLGEIFSIQQGKALSQKNQTGKSPKPFLRTANVLWGNLDLSTVDQMDFTEEEIHRLALKPNDLLVCEGGDIGRTAIWNGEIDPCSYQNHIHRLRLIRSDVEPQFIMYWMQAAIKIFGFYEGEGNKTTIPNLSKARLSRFLVPLPPLPEQRAIARTHRAVQAAREARLREVALERERKAALMKHLFTHGTRGEATKQTEIGEMPESWHIVKLGEIVLDGPQNGIYKPLELYGEGAPIIRIDDFDNYGSFLNLKFERVRLSIEEIEKYRVNERDIIINRVNSLSHLGKCALIPKLVEPTVFESNMMRFHVNEEKIIPEFLLRYLVTDDNRNRIRNIAKRAVAQSSINQGDVKSLEIPVTLLPEQREISRAINACDSKITALGYEAQLLDELFRAMLEELMSGRLRTDGLTEPEG